MARSFNGSSDYINAGSAAALNNLFSNSSSPMTVSAWVYATGALSGFATIAELVKNGTIEQYLLRLNNATVNWGSDVGVVSSTSSISANTWTHLAGTFDGTNIAIWFNGSSQASASGSPDNAGGGQSLLIGAGFPGLPSPGRFWSGRLADVTLWNVALSAGEIGALANGARPHLVRPASFVAFWPLDGLASPEPDLSGNANNGTLTGTAQASGPPVTLFTAKSISSFIPPPPAPSIGLLMGQVMI